MKNKKPEKHTKSYYEYLECCDYLQEKYKYDERNYTNTPIGERHQDFWYWVLKHHDVHNGCFICFSKEALEDEDLDAEDWVKEIYKHYIDEFADENGELEMYVWW